MAAWVETRGKERFCPRFQFIPFPSPIPFLWPFFTPFMLSPLVYPLLPRLYFSFSPSPEPPFPVQESCLLGVHLYGAFSRFSSLRQSPHLSIFKIISICFPVPVFSPRTTPFPKLSRFDLVSMCSINVLSSPFQTEIPFLPGPSPPVDLLFPHFSFRGGALPLLFRRSCVVSFSGYTHLVITLAFLCSPPSLRPLSLSVYFTHDSPRLFRFVTNSS